MTVFCVDTDIATLPNRETCRVNPHARSYLLLSSGQENRSNPYLVLCMQADEHTDKKQKMAQREVIATSYAPAAIGPYSQAVKAGGFVFVSGCIGMSPETKAIVPGGVGPECRQVLSNMKAVLEAAGSDMAKVCKTTILLKDMSSFAEVNGIYGEYFSAEAGYPARATYAVAGLPLGALVEIEAVALA